MRSSSPSRSHAGKGSASRNGFSSERARRSGYRRRFALIYGTLALLGGIAIGAFVVLLGGPDVVPTPKWSSWEPSGSSDAKVLQIADHVARPRDDLTCCNRRSQRLAPNHATLPAGRAQFA